MLAIERRTEIMRLIHMNHSVRVNKLSERFKVTEETIRRDLDKLDKEGKVKKTYGGAVLVKNVSDDSSFNDRLKVNMSEKRMIASLASTLIKDGETVFIDMSTTALEVIKNLDPSKKITVITNSLDALVELSQKDNVKLITLGGYFNPETHAMDGPMTTRYIDNYYVDKTLFSVKAISMERGIMDSRELAAEIKRHMIKNAKRAMMLVDYSKFDQAALTKIVEVSDVDLVVTEYNLSQEWLDYFDSNDTKVMIAK